MSDLFPKSGAKVQLLLDMHKNAHDYQLVTFW